MKLDNVSEADLLAEIERRKKRALPVPQTLPVPNWDPLIKMIEESLAESIKQGYENDDFQHYVYEMAMKAVYGDGYFPWRNAQRWG